MKMKLPFKVYVDGRSEEIQNHLFALGCKWRYGGLAVLRLDSPFLFVDADKMITHGDGMQHFKEKPSPELTADQVLDLPVEKPAHQFKPFDRVLMRDDSDDCWMADLYSHRLDNDRHVCTGGVDWVECIPYEGNEHLIGTNKSPA